MTRWTYGHGLRLGMAVGACLILVRCAPPDLPSEAGSTVEGPGDVAPPEATPAGASVRAEGTGVWPAAQDSIAGTPWTRQDWEIFTATLAAADAAGLGEMPPGEAVAEMGLLFLDAPYEPRTLEVPGPERLVVNLRALDCVTFVENVLALSRFHRVHGTAALQDADGARRSYEEILRALRYRNGRIDGYASRLHYFSDWIREGAERGRLADVTAALGGIPDPEPLDFMTAHVEAYPQLADPAVTATVAAVERELNARGPRIYLPQEGIQEAQAGIRTGDVIAATSTLEGLDVAHTGIAVWSGGELHLLHAPLVGESVTLSPRPLARRILETSSQDGILVARPADEWLPSASTPPSSTGGA